MAAFLSQVGIYACAAAIRANVNFLAADRAGHWLLPHETRLLTIIKIKDGSTLQNSHGSVISTAISKPVPLVRGDIGVVISEPRLLFLLPWAFLLLSAF
ncbi:hypothetical protein PH552_05740 [Rhizobium sp. CNPSo 3968]|uniref:hypothetical protein n=1 Tax=Rhizobium sp. CNPSo 3968 TaxID=3021408 RepID=UPI000DDDD0BA|nr:hypothetical protein [Rhizobium sp. CNPSo 3968]MDK4718846.1 hypothetical protein [Rhizobium sp. CNPSo 3968]